MFENLKEVLQKLNIKLVAIKLLPYLAQILRKNIHINPNNQKASSYESPVTLSNNILNNCFTSGNIAQAFRKIKSIPQNYFAVKIEYCTFQILLL